MFAGKKSAQIREILISESTWEEMTCLFAPSLDHRPPTTIKPVNAEVAALQQQTADLFYENRLVPKKVDIRQRIWQPTQLEGKQL